MESHSLNMNVSSESVVSRSGFSNETLKTDECLPHVLHDLEEEIERELEIKAEKNKLTTRNVKNMIKAVITNEDVIKMVDYSLKRTEEKPPYEPKLTRAKTKGLKGIEQNALLNIPVGQKKSDIEVLITQDLPEDSSDEEYVPQDEWSDEEPKVNDSMIEDETVKVDSEVPCEPAIDSKFQTKENIGQRTRSKLSLSQTPLEVIEQAFIPPDITPEMYNTDCDNVDWLNFLKEFTQPLDSNQVEANDDDNDPEYNVMVDEELEATDVEELRVDRAVQVTKRELSDLMAELFEYTDMLSSEDEEENEIVDREVERHCELGYFGNALVSGDPKNNSFHRSIEKKLIDVEAVEFPSPYLAVLQQQLQQHVQLLLQSFLLSYKNPFLGDDFSFCCKSYLFEFLYLKNQKSCASCFNIINLMSSIKLIEEWELFLNRPEALMDISSFISCEIAKYEKARLRKLLVMPELPPTLVQMCLKSDAFLYPLYLPKYGFRDFTGSLPKVFTYSESHLLAIALEEFSSFLKLDLTLSEDLSEIAESVHVWLMPAKSRQEIVFHVNYSLTSKHDNPIKELYRTQHAPSVQHYVVLYSEKHLKKLTEHQEIVPSTWQKYLMS